jgi:hypothetical protein
MCRAEGGGAITVLPEGPRRSEPPEYEAGCGRRVSLDKILRRVDAVSRLRSMRRLCASATETQISDYNQFNVGIERVLVQ